VFVDTNVLVYAHVAEAPWHQEAQDAIVDHEAAGAPLWVSRQVLREYLVSLTHRARVWAAGLGKGAEAAAGGGATR
jgi:predicted nucleic acid-binding protein